MEGVDDDLLRVFAPRRARKVAWTLAVGIVVLMSLLGLWVPDATWLDRVAFIALGLAIGWFLSRQAMVRAVPSPNGLHVRNLLLSRDLEWAEIVAVRLGDNPWVQLDLADGDTLSVMGIQRSDGIERAEAEASRLAWLVDRYSPTPNR